MVYWTLGYQFIIRSLIHHRARSVIAIVGIALGVAVMLAIQVANHASLESFRAAASSMSGDASLEIHGGAGRFDELVLRDLNWLEQFGQVSPVVEGYASLEQPGAARPLVLHVLGVDVLRDRGIRDYNLVGFGNDPRQPRAREFLTLLADSHAVVLTQKLADELGLATGSQLTLDIGGKRRVFTVRGLLSARGPARALDGRFALMDIAAAQWALDRLGYLDRLDLRLNEGLDADKAAAEIRRKLPSGLQVNPPDESYRQMQKMISAFHFNLDALGSISLIVGLFLIYNSISVSVHERRGEIGILRAVGASRGTVAALFLGQAGLLSAVGAAIGLPVGRLLGGAAIRSTATAVNTFYVAQAATSAVSDFHLSALLMAAVFAGAVMLSLSVAWFPAIGAARISPIESIRASPQGPAVNRRRLRVTAIGFGLFGAAALFSQVRVTDRLPLAGYASAVCFMFVGALLTPAVLWSACTLISRYFPRTVRSIRLASRLGAANLVASIHRVSVSVSALAVSLAMMVAVAIMIGSFRETVAYWVDRTLGADIYVKPVGRQLNLPAGEIPPDAMEAIRRDSDVAAVDSYYSLPASYMGLPITIATGDFSVLLAHGGLLFKSPADGRARVAQSIDNGEDAIVVSESFELAFKKEAGDIVELPTPAGPFPFRIVGVYFDYSTSRGAVAMDRSTYARRIGASSGSAVPISNLSVYLRPGIEPSGARARLESALSPLYPVEFYTNSYVRREVHRIFDSTFAITYALEAISIVVAGLGVFSTLTALILDRRREIAVMRMVGGAKSQIRSTIIIEALLIGGVSQFLGVMVGIAVSVVLVYVINVQSFHWTIQYHLPIGFFAGSTAVLLPATALAALIPGTRASRSDISAIVREE